MDLIDVYDCYTITVLMTIEDSGFCPRGEGQAFVREHDLSFRGDFPCNPYGGQLASARRAWPVGCRTSPTPRAS